MTLSLMIFFFGVLGFVFNRKNIILMLLCIEMILLGATLFIILISYFYSDSVGTTFSVFVITTAGAESALGLGLLVAYFRTSGNIELKR